MIRVDMVLSNFEGSLNCGGNIFAGDCGTDGLSEWSGLWDWLVMVGRDVICKVIVRSERDP